MAPGNALAPVCKDPMCSVSVASSACVPACAVATRSPSTHSATSPVDCLSCQCRHVPTTEFVHCRPEEWMNVSGIAEPRGNMPALAPRQTEVIHDTGNLHRQQGRRRGTTSGHERRRVRLASGRNATGDREVVGNRPWNLDRVCSTSPTNSACPRSPASQISGSPSKSRCTTLPVIWPPQHRREIFGWITASYRLHSPVHQPFHIATDRWRGPRSTA